ncbi:MAG: hypothetical protein ACREFB_09845, partial [Stellaceae bacterium]
MMSLRRRAAPATPLRPIVPVAKSLVQMPAANAVAVPRLMQPAPAPSSDRPRRHLHLLSFVLVVMLPVLGAAVYWLGIAADQYVAKFRFTLRIAEPPPV